MNEPDIDHNCPTSQVTRITITDPDSLIFIADGLAGFNVCINGSEPVELIRSEDGRLVWYRVGKNIQRMSPHDIDTFEVL